MRQCEPRAPAVTNELIFRGGANLSAVWRPSAVKNTPRSSESPFRALSGWYVGCSVLSQIMVDHPDTPPVVVVIAASAGGLRALRTILAGLPKSFPAALVIVQHRSMGSMLTSLLEKKSALPVSNAVEGQTVEAGHVYVNRPDRHLTINAEHRFEYHGGQKIRHVLSSANPLFESSADVFGPGTIGVVLTGSDHDGTDGVQAIKSGGGIVIAQDEATSEHFHMPASAISTGSVDYVLPLDDIAPALVRLVQRREAH